MLGRRSSARMRDLFADQFMPSDGGDYIYRRSGKGEAVRVSAAERDLFVADFARFLRRSTWGVFAATIALIAALVFLAPVTGRGQDQMPMTVGIGAIVASFLVVSHRGWTRPARALARRAVVARALTGEEARRLALSKITYGQLALSVLMAGMLAVNHSPGRGMPHGWDALWLAAAALMVAVAAMQAFRKWRYDRGR